MYDKALPPVKPTPGAAWRLTVSDSMEGNWLGVRNLDRRYVYGSKLADQRYRANGYCRVHMPSIPRAGSTWFRTMFEVATGRPTASVWPEGGRQDAARRYHIVDGHACGANPAQMEGNKLPRGAPPCRNLTAPAPDDPVLMKSHTPFFPSYDRPALDPGATCAVLLIVRNPLDAHDAWRRYAGGTAEPLRKWLPVWAGHLTHWVADTRDLPIIAFRYEDLLWRADKVLEQVLRALGPGWEWSRESIERAVRTYGPREPFEDKCGKAIPHYTLAEVEMVRKHYAGLLGRFGYAIEGAGGAAPPQ
ncbi:P-loop containing nucleoside triphosphate hydrolase protein [Tribonema minus]|uniref:P-loop containing nucleoside triphosphate hydrolase protein n=1 Tax=Tribonema minus TaxID=303371 RepID=A0A835YVS2_9STRA|nr:P-loop containing nucleoside triphosphate hydrolase protein [Tribonema minus]